MPLVALIIAGAGSRGSTYAGFAAGHPDRAHVVGVAEPREFYRQRQVEAHRIPSANVFPDWADMARRPRFADAVVIATPDALHAGPALAFARKGYHILLEKPMAPNERDCRRIVAAVKRAGVIFAVSHVMRYTRYTQAQPSQWNTMPRLCGVPVCSSS